MGFFDFFKKGNKDNEVKAEEAAGTTIAAESAAPETGAGKAISENSEGVVSADTSESDEAELSTPAADAPQKLTPEQLAERKAQQEELTKKRDSDGMVLSYLIQRHHEVRTEDSFKSVLDSLTNCWLWVPMRMQMSKNDAAAMQEAQKNGQKYAPKDPVRLAPQLIKTKDDELIYSSFTNRDEIPKEMTKQFIWIQVPSGHCAQTVVASPKISALVINPNSKSLLLKRELLEKLVKPVPRPDAQAAQDLASEPDTTGYTS